MSSGLLSRARFISWSSRSFSCTGTFLSHGVNAFSLRSLMMIFFFSYSHLTKPNGIVVSLSSSVEVDSLFDVIMALIVPGQMVGSCPVPCVIGYFRCLTS